MKTIKLYLYNTQIKSKKKFYADSYSNLLNVLYDADMLGHDKDFHILACAEMNRVDFEELEDAAFRMWEAGEIRGPEYAPEILIPDFQEPTDEIYKYVILDNLDTVYRVEFEEED